MSLSVGVTTSQFITLQTSALEERLLAINSAIQKISNYTVEASTQLVNAYRGQTTINGIDVGNNADDAAELIDTVNDTNFTAAYEAMLAQYNQKEKMLDVEKSQIELQIKALSTEQDGVDKMIDKDIQGAFKYGQ